jgi:hypothetical protein
MNLLFVLFYGIELFRVEINLPYRTSSFSVKLVRPIKINIK